MFVYVYLLASMCTTCLQYPWRPEEVTGSHGSGVTSGCDLSCGCWELDSELLSHLPSSHKFLEALVLSCLTQIMLLLAMVAFLTSSGGCASPYNPLWENF